MLEFLEKVHAIRNSNDVSVPKDGSCSIKTKSGQLIVTKTSADVRKLASRSVSGILIVEAAQCEFSVLPKSIGRVSQERGWILMCGTLEGSNWYAQLRDEWVNNPNNEFEGRAFTLPTWSNRAVFPLGIDDPEIIRLKKLYSRTPGLFEERCAGITTMPHGAIFRDFSYAIHVSDGIRFMKNLPVYIGVDPGAGGPSHYAVAAVQFHPSNIPDGDMKEIAHVVDVVYLEGADFDVAYKEVSRKPWYPNIVGGAIDVEAPDEKKRWMRVGISLTSKKIPVLQGERRLQSFLTHPSHIFFSTDVPERALLEFSLYRNPSEQSWNERRTGPEHMLKALWYLLVSRFGFVVPEKTFSVIVRQTVKDLYNAYSRGSA